MAGHDCLVACKCWHQGRLQPSVLVSMASSAWFRPSLIQRSNSDPFLISSSLVLPSPCSTFCKAQGSLSMACTRHACTLQLYEH